MLELRFLWKSTSQKKMGTKFLVPKILIPVSQNETNKVCFKHLDVIDWSFASYRSTTQFWVEIGRQKLKLLLWVWKWPITKLSWYYIGMWKAWWQVLYIFVLFCFVRCVLFNWYFMLFRNDWEKYRMCQNVKWGRLGHTWWRWRWLSKWQWKRIG